MGPFLTFDAMRHAAQLGPVHRPRAEGEVGHAVLEVFLDPLGQLAPLVHPAEPLVGQDHDAVVKDSMTNLSTEESMQFNKK